LQGEGEGRKAPATLLLDGRLPSKKKKEKGKRGNAKSPLFPRRKRKGGEEGIALLRNGASTILASEGKKKGKKNGASRVINNGVVTEGEERKTKGGVALLLS